MDTLSPHAARFLCIIAPHAAHASMLDLSARLAVQAPLRVLDGGNQFNLYPVARAIRRLTPHLTATLSQITLSRAFTCHQMAAMLAATAPLPTPILVLDLLSTFYDEAVSSAERRRLLQASLAYLTQLSQHAPIIVSARPPAVSTPAQQALLSLLRQSTARVWESANASSISQEEINGTYLTFNYTGLS